MSACDKPAADGFDNLGLGPATLRGVGDAGYSEPTPIQRQAIPHILAGRDLLGCAQTGTGKTASFVLPAFEILSASRQRARMPRALILEPTRELAAQVRQDIEVYGAHHDFEALLLTGGYSFDNQARALSRGADILIATPGRLLDHFERGRILLSGVKLFIIDEADRMLDMGFMPDVERIVALTPPSRQTLFFSATMPEEMRRLAQDFLNNPEEVTVAPPSSAAENVAHNLAVVRAGDKPRAAAAVLKDITEQAIVFCNRKRDIGTLLASLRANLGREVNVVQLHGDMAQPMREQVLESFRNGEAHILVASDVAARGLDISGISHAVNYDVPFNPEDYIHRVGRTGRAGRSGIAWALATPYDGKAVAAIELLLARNGKAFERVALEGIACEEFAQDNEEGGAPMATSRRSEGGEGRGGRGRERGRERGRARGRGGARYGAQRDGARYGAQRDGAPHGHGQSRRRDGRSEGAPESRGGDRRLPAFLHADRAESTRRDGKPRKGKGGWLDRFLGV